MKESVLNGFSCKLSETTRKKIACGDDFVLKLILQEQVDIR